MRLERQFDVQQSAGAAARIAARDDTLLSLFPDSSTEIVEREEAIRTTRTHYSMLGRPGVATFRFFVLPEGSISFEKVCDGNVWEELKGQVSFCEHGEGARVTLQMTGRTKTFVPELTISGSMQDQIEEMASALRTCIEAG
jgi:hypothetical protein